MSAIEVNKFAGAVLFALLVMFGARTVSNIVFHPHSSDVPGWDIAVEGSDGGAPAADAAPEVSLAQLLSEADADKGKRGANKCAGCHTFDQGGATRSGPNLYGIVGRSAGAVAGYDYSTALAGKGAWTYEALDAFIKNPKAYAPGTKMNYAGISRATSRADLILYLRSLSASPTALPTPEPVAAPAAVEADAPAAPEKADEAEAAQPAEAAPAGDDAKTGEPAPASDPEPTGSIEKDAVEETAPPVALPDRNTKRKAAFDADSEPAR